MSARIVVLGVFVADMCFRASRPPRPGETIIGSSFVLGPGGKGSNQAVGAARAGGDVTLLTRVGEDTFGQMADELWRKAGVEAHILHSEGQETGAAYIYVDDQTGENAIIIYPGAGSQIAPADIDVWADDIAGAEVFMTQLEQPIDAALVALRAAKAGGATTILNPAPAAALPDEIWSLCDFVTPNETEAAEITGLPVVSEDDARRAADRLCEMGAGGVVMTLGEKGALLHGPGRSDIVPAICHAPVLDTTGAGDAFNAGVAVALAEGKTPLDAAWFGSATAGLAVTRIGTAQAMPERSEILDALQRAGRG